MTLLETAQRLIPPHWTAEKMSSYGVVLTCPEGSVTVSEFMRNFTLGCSPVRERGDFVGHKWKDRLCVAAIAKLKEHEDYWTNIRREHAAKAGGTAPATQEPTSDPEGAANIWRRDGYHGDNFLPSPTVTEAAKEEIRKAVEADIQQYFTDSMTPDRGYATPIDNVSALISRLLGNTEAELRKLREQLHEIDMQTEGYVDGAADRSELSAVCCNIQHIIHPTN